ncbi:sulfite exporter TauE/SafE family protein [Halovulum dunhuangense]|uniref:Probable membrane transporter protein n=1 Tax=Halovulum dunhuangense TaxID=1505036 RepID=A0A849L3S4_9RHOB|nr:sulfite exporter TauE/SafE family protein [Halovulum dunhuangense]NNU80975.1 sulfite exporter TauE/SafE family protein [Halovulum dunhuangense]
MTADVFLYLAAGTLAGGFINGLAGFGTALFALGFFLNVMSPVQAVAIIVVLSALSGLQGVWLVRHTIRAQSARLLRFLLPAIVAIPLGVWALALVDAQTLKLVTGGFLLLYGGYFSLRSALPKFERATPVADGAIGFAGGFLGGAAGLSGALPTMWCSLRPWPKAETRAVLQPFNVVILGLTGVMLAWQGAYDRQTVISTAIALPMALAASQMGIFVFRRVSDDTFRRLLIGLTFVSGAVLLARELL